MRREIKFRAWIPDTGWLSDGFSIAMDGTEWYDDNGHSWPLSQLELMQFIGLKDKNGKEIYEQFLLRMKGKMGENAEYSFDAIYKVNEVSYKGVSLSFCRLYSKEPDDHSNSYPIAQSPSFYNGSLYIDYINNMPDRLVIRDTFGRNASFKKVWKEHHYTNDIEIIGNIYENPDLLTDPK